MECGSGTQHRTRSCTDPPPSQFGMSCNEFSNISENELKPDLNVFHQFSDDWIYVGVEKKAYENMNMKVYENRSCISNTCDSS